MIDYAVQFINNRKGYMKRIILVGITLFTLFIFRTTAFAQGPPAGAGAAATKNWKDVNAQTNGAALDTTDMNAQSSVHTSNQYSMESLACLSIGIACTAKTEDWGEKICGSTMGKLNEVIAQTFTTPPADTGVWLADVGTSLGFIPKQAMAQGIGFSGMMPLLPLWKAFRNISYLLMAIIMIALGFMIMFRKKIDPKTVVTAQNAIPKVVIALILITFSYAIVGIMIDIMYVVIYFLIALFKSTGLLENPQFPTCLMYKTPETLYGQGGLLANFLNLTWDPYKILGLSFLNANPGQLSSILSVAGAASIIGLMGIPGVGPVAAGVAGVGFLTLPLLHLLLSIAIIFLFVRLLFFFLAAYIQIIISLLIAPLQLLMEAMPGSTAFSSWFSNLVSNLIVFPIGAAMFMLSNVFTHFSNNTASGTIWAPPFAPLSGGMQQIASLVSLGVLFAIPQVAGSIREAMKAKPAVNMSGPNVGGAWNTGMQLLSAAFYLKQFKGNPQDHFIAPPGPDKHKGGE